MADDERATRPATIGELRRRLKDLGEPWSVPARFNDDDPLPDPPRSGEPVEHGHVQGLRAVNTREEFEACPREIQPTNPFLTARWRKLGLVGTGVRRVIGLIQSTFAADLEIIAENQNGGYQHWWRDGSGWHPRPTI